MDSKVEKNESVLTQIMGQISLGNNFVLKGGAGSGKTYTLVQVIQQILESHPRKKIACITYTNAAVDEILERTKHPNLQVSTIHDFLWSAIHNFQKDLKKTIVELVNEAIEKDKEGVKENKKYQLRISGNEPFSLESYDGVTIKYKEYVKLRRGVISHDQLLVVAERMFKDNGLLSRILKDRYPFILVDEYQDTDKQVISILLEHLPQTPNKCIVGFFGDAMQSIYDDRASIEHYIEKGKLACIVKKQNRRNPQSVIDLANKLRTDGVKQAPSDDNSAPNMEGGKVKQGSVKFLYSTSEDGVDLAKKFLGWNFELNQDLKLQSTKELNLTHRLIANKVGIPNLYSIYDGDKILEYVKRIKDYIEDNEITDDFSNFTFEQVIEYLSKGKDGKELKKVTATPAQNKYIQAHQDQYEFAKGMNYELIIRLYVHKDQLLANEEEEKGQKSDLDHVIKHLLKIEEVINLYKTARYNEFIQKTDYRKRLTSIAAKKELKRNINEFINEDHKTIVDVITKASAYGLVEIDDEFERYREAREYVYRQVAKVSYSEFKAYYKYKKNFTPYSTQHKTKGSEYSNVFVILDNGAWNNYNFEVLFGKEGKETVKERSEKIFYVCCTRAKDNLAVFFGSPSELVLETATNWFGKKNVVNLDEWDKQQENPT